MDGTGDIESSGGLARVGDVLFGADEIVGRWIEERLEAYQYMKGTPALAIVKNSKPVAAVAYDRFNGVHVEATIVSEDKAWYNRSNMHAIFYYPFVTLGCEAISVCVPASNLSSLNLALRMGFKPEAYVTFAAHDGSALVVLKMFRENCTWIERNGKKQTAGAAGLT